MNPHQKEEMKREFEKTFSNVKNGKLVNSGYGITGELLMENLMDFFLSKFDSYIEGIRKEVESRKEVEWEYDKVCTHYQDRCSCRSDKEVKKHNEAVRIKNALCSDFIKLLTKE